MLDVLRWGRASPRVRIAAASLPVVMVTTLLHLIGASAGTEFVGYAALVVYIGAEWPRLPGITRGLVALALASAALVVGYRPEPLPVLVNGLERAAYFATFITALGFLREAASTSQLVRRCGRGLIRQPPAKRYAALTTGSLLFGIILNLGVVNLLGVMISGSNTLSAAGGQSVIQRVRQRRMVTALLRGFSAIPLASPLSITLAVLLSTMEGLRWYDLLPLGVLGAVVLLVFGWWLDRRTAPRHLAHLAPASAERLELAPVGQFLALVLLIVGVAMTVQWALGVRLFIAVLLTAPPIAVLWMAAQRRRVGAATALRYALLRLGRRATHLFPALRAEVGILGSAAFTGVMLTALLPPGALPELLVSLHLSGVSVAVGVLVAIVVGAQIGLNPIVLVTLLASTLSRPEQLGLPAPVLGLAFMSGWALAINSSVLTAAVLMLARMSGVSPVTVSYRWNGVYTLGGTVLMAGLLIVVDWVLSSY